MLSCAWAFRLSIETVLSVFYGSSDDLIFSFANIYKYIALQVQFNW